MAKKRKKVPPAGVALTPAEIVSVSSASFDEFIADIDTPLGKQAGTPAERRQTRRFCMGQWDALDIGVVNRVEGGEPGWGMTRF